MIETWVLVFYLHGSGKTIATVPGYATKAECQSGAADLPPAKFDYVVCIRGPSRSR